MSSKNIRLEVTNASKSYNTPQTEMKTIIKNGYEENPTILETLNQTEQERGNTREGLFTILNNKIKPQHNETINSL